MAQNSGPPNWTYLPGRTTRSPRVVPVAIACAVAAVMLAVFFVSRDGGSRSPEATVRELYRAAGRKDCEAIISLMSSEASAQDGTYAEQLASCHADFAEGPEEFAIYSVDEASREGDRAKVVIDLTIEGERQTMTWLVVKESGAWKIVRGS